jgi:glycosyltransferase involved in cell wall biosynthesis
MDEDTRIIPLVSCILPTANRERFLASAVRLFDAQSFKDCELVILDEQEAAPSTYGRVRWYSEPSTRSLGEKHNRLVELAKGDIILHWADDDWYAPWRIAYQVGLMEQFGWDMCTTSETLWVDAAKKKAWHWNPPDPRNYNAAMTCYRRKVWEKSPYEDVATGEDASFIRNALANGFSLGLKLDYRFAVQRIWSGNTVSNQQMHSDWSVPFEDVKAVIGGDWEKFFGGASGMPR